MKNALPQPWKNLNNTATARIDVTISVVIKKYSVIPLEKMIKFTSFLPKISSIAGYYLQFLAQSGNNLYFFFRHIIIERSQ